MRTPKDLLEGKYLLLDTNVLIELQKNQGRSEELYSFFQDIKEAPCALLTIDQVVGEFLKFAKSEEDYVALLQYANDLSPPLLPTKQDLYISNQIYLAIENEDKNLAKKISATDLLLGAVLARFSDHLFLATANHKDFPTFFYDRVFIFGFENLEGNIQNICIIKFNHQKFENLFSRFSRSRKKE